MTATKRLRELLDERVVRWKRVRGHKDNGTSWHDVYGSYVEAVQEYAWDGGEFPEDKMVVRRGPAYMTPEQAIAATLGSSNCTNGERTNKMCLPYFWTHDGTLHVELPKLPESISVRLPDQRDREVHSAKVWQYTLGDSDATPTRQGVGTCKADETDTMECVCDGIGHYGESLTVHVMECSACGGTYEYVNGGYEFCPRCGAKVVVE